jgi:hypothetical protein
MAMLNWRYLIVVAIAIMSFPVAEAAELEGIGKVRIIKGDAHLVRAGTRATTKVGSIVRQNDVIETGASSSIGITFNDNTVFSTGPNSRVSMEEFKFNPVTLKGSFLAKLGRGTLSVVSGDIARGSPKAMRIRTPSAILGVRGTRFLVRVNED